MCFDHSKLFLTSISFTSFWRVDQSKRSHVSCLFVRLRRSRLGFHHDIVSHGSKPWWQTLLSLTIVIKKHCFHDDMDPEVGWNMQNLFLFKGSWWIKHVSRWFFNCDCAFCDVETQFASNSETSLGRWGLFRLHHSRWRLENLGISLANESNEHKWCHETPFFKPRLHHFLAFLALPQVILLRSVNKKKTNRIGWNTYHKSFNLFIGSNSVNSLSIWTWNLSRQSECRLLFPWSWGASRCRSNGWRRP